MDYCNNVYQDHSAPPHWWNCCLFNYACAWAVAERKVAGLAAGFYLSKAKYRAPRDTFG